MRLTSVVLAAAVGGTMIVYSCGELAQKSDDKAADEAEPVKTFATAQTLAIEGASVGVPAGAFEDGTTLEFKKVDAPGDFAALGDEGSVAAALIATDKGGASVPSSAVPLTIGLEIEEAAALTGGKPEDLCLIALLTKDSLKVAWSYATLKVDGSTAAIVTKLLGTFQLRYCGGKQVAGFTAGTKAADGSLEVGSSSTTASSGTGYGSCDLASVGICYQYWGTAYSNAQLGTSISEGCTKGTGTFNASGACKGDGAVGTCVYNTGTTLESAWTYYSTESKFTAEAAQKACEDVNATKLGTTKWYAVGSYVPTAADKQTEYTAPANPSPGPAPGPAPAPSPGGDATGTCSLPAGSGACYLAAGAICYHYAGPKWGDKSGSCQGMTYHAGGCPAEGAIRCCVQKASNQDYAYAIVYYTGSTATCSPGYTQTDL